VNHPYESASVYVEISIANQPYASYYPVRYLLLVPTQIPTDMLCSRYLLYEAATFDISDIFDVVIHFCFVDHNYSRITAVEVRSESL
jgi:hypothetical protein